MKYRFVPAPKDYPGHIYSWGNRILEHHAVWWKSKRRVVPIGYILHHKNGNGLDNRVSNLELMTVGKHTRLHCKLWKSVKFDCPLCGDKFKRPGNYVRFKLKEGSRNFYCSRSCSAKASNMRVQPRQKKDKVQSVKGV